MANPSNESGVPAATGACPCGSGKLLALCCGPVLAGERLAATAEELMRARFTAHATGNFEFLHRTYKPTAKLPFEPGGEAPATQWTRLVVHSHEPGRVPNMAYVDFSAYGMEKGLEYVLHEKAEFIQEDGAWIYTRPLREGPAPVKMAAKKPGRNDPCPCGSGRKFKHCCLAKA